MEATLSMFLINSPDHFYAEASLANDALEAVLGQWFSNFNGQHHLCSFKGISLDLHPRNSNSVSVGLSPGIWLFIFLTLGNMP